MTSPLSLLTTKGTRTESRSPSAFCWACSPTQAHLRPPAAEAEVEDRPVVAEEAERQRVVRIDQGAPRLGRGRGRGQDQEGGQGRPTRSSDDAGASLCFLEHADLLRSALGCPTRAGSPYVTPRQARRQRFARGCGRPRPSCASTPSPPSNENPRAASFAARGFHCTRPNPSRPSDVLSPVRPLEIRGRLHLIHGPADAVRLAATHQRSAGTTRSAARRG